MNILAFHFGHDSAVTFIKNGEIVGCQLSERVKETLINEPIASGLAHTVRDFETGRASQ